jgi:hypothetical protein
VEEAVGVHVIIKGLREARNLVSSLVRYLSRAHMSKAIKRINEIAVTVDKSDPA